MEKLSAGPKETECVVKNWGNERIIINGIKYCGKRIYISQGAWASYHYHKKKEETFFILSGQLLVKYARESDIRDICVSRDITEEEALNDFEFEKLIMNEGDVLHLPPRTRHWFMGLKDTVFFELSTHHDDKDVVRIIPSCPK